MRQVLQGNGVGLVADREGDLDEEVHDHETTSTESVGQDLQRISNEQAGPGDGVRDIKEPDEHDLRVSETLDVRFAGNFETSGDNGPGNEHKHHAYMMLMGLW